jgi:hypothetical protein
VEGGWIRIRFEHVCLLAGRGADWSRERSRLEQGGEDLFLADITNRISTYCTICISTDGFHYFRLPFVERKLIFLLAYMQTLFNSANPYRNSLQEACSGFQIAAYDYTVTRRTVKFRYIHMMTPDDNGPRRENIFRMRAG